MSEDTGVSTILVAINMTEHSRRAFYVALNMAAKYGAQTFVLHVSEPIRSFDFGKKRYVETTETIERVQEGVNARLQELWEAGGKTAVDRRKVDTVVRGGNAAAEILASARAKRADLIVLGLGSGTVAEQVVRDAPCSVYCVREREF